MTAMADAVNRFDPEEWSRRVYERGYAVCDHGITDHGVQRLIEEITGVQDSPSVRRRGAVFGIRNLLEYSVLVRLYACCDDVRRFVTPVLGNAAFAVRAVFFDKVPSANWVLGWHQDSVISVAQKRDVDGFIAWGQKDGVWQVQPPAAVLAQMLAIRIHLDDCPASNGALQVMPGSHRNGWVEDNLEHWKATAQPVTCCTVAGGIMAMRPLLLHASSRATEPRHRRVIHIEYANSDLPGGLEWNIRVR